MATPLTSKDSLLFEINKSKMSYSYDSIGDEPTFHGYVLDGFPDGDNFQTIADANGIDIGQVIIRYDTDSHVPEDAPIYKVITRRSQRAPKPTGFPPFRDFKFQNNVLLEVRRSHWKGDLVEGEFCATHGRVTDRLLLQCQTIVNQRANQANFRGYSFLDDMRSEAMERLFQRVLKFKETSGNSPYSYISTTIHNAFIDVINTEKKHASTKRDLYLETQGGRKGVKSNDY